MRLVAVIHGPNLDRLGTREPEIYGRTMLAEVDEAIRREAAGLGCEVAISQHACEGSMVEAIHAASDSGASGLLLNAAAYSHTSVAIRDAILAAGLPTVEVHLSNPYAREPFRHRSLVADVALGRVMGFGAQSYVLGLRGLWARLTADEGV